MAENGKVILVADDKLENRKLLFALLTGSGYTVFTTGSGVECLSLLRRVRPSLIVLDVMMPEMDGFETCRRIRAEQGLRDIPILFVSAYPFIENIQRVASVGGNDFVAKPFDIDVLLQRVAALVVAGARHALPQARLARRL